MNIDYNKYTPETLEFMYADAEKHINALTASFREINNKSYLLLGLLISTLTGLLGYMVKTEFYSIYTLLFFLLLIPTALLVPNVKPSKFGFPGSEPKKLVHPYFEEDTLNQYKKLLVQRIEDSQKIIDLNAEIVSYRSLQITRTLKSLFLILSVTLFLWLSCFFT